MTNKSAGILLYRVKNGEPEFLLVHPGGPFFAKKDLGSWSIPKGEFDNEDPLIAAKREFFEETGQQIGGEFVELTPIQQKDGKLVFAFANEGDFDPKNLKSNTFEMFGKKFPEVDKAEWFKTETVLQKITSGQDKLIEELTDIIGL